MKQLIMGLAVAGVLCMAGTVQAASSVSGTNLRIETLESVGGTGLALLSDSGSTLTLSVTNLMSPGYWGVRSPYSGGENGNGDYSWTTLQFDVRDGYRVTALTLSGKAYGVLDATRVPGDGPDFSSTYAHNAFDFSWSVNGTAPVYHVSGQDVVGNQTFSGTAAQAIQGRSVLDFSTALSAEVKGYLDYQCTDHCWTVEYPASAGIQISDVVMTVQIAPVPEPATYAMLLGGLVLTGVVARRRKA